VGDAARGAALFDDHEAVAAFEPAVERVLVARQDKKVARVAAHVFVDREWDAQAVRLLGAAPTAQ
jgi:hypothetical protein